MSYTDDVVAAQERERLRARIKALEESVEAHKVRVAELEARLARITITTSVSGSDYIAELQARVAELEAELALAQQTPWVPAEAEVARLREAGNALAEAADKWGKPGANDFQADMRRCQNAVTGWREALAGGGQ